MERHPQKSNLSYSLYKIRCQMHTVQLILRPTEYEKAVINKRFHAVSHIHNVCGKHAKKLLMQLDHDNEYQSWRSEYCKLLKQKKLSINSSAKSVSEGP